MNKYNVIVRPLIALLAAYFLLANVTLSVAAEDGDVLYWVAPMDPNYRRDK